LLDPPLGIFGPVYADFTSDGDSFAGPSTNPDPHRAASFPMGDLVKEIAAKERNGIYNAIEPW